jgi:2-keto-4-pentenoate hydratase
MNGAASAFSTDAAGAIADRFVRARLDARPLAEYPGPIPADLDAAYRCQEQAIARWPEPVAGWKVARIPADQQSRYAAERLIGPAFASNIHFVEPGHPAQCAVFEGGFAAVEAELIIKVGADAPATKSEWTIDEAADYVGALYFGIEVASSPLATLNDIGAGAVISDFGNNWGIVVGQPISAWRTVHEVVALSYIDDEFVGRGAVSLRHGPLAALAFTLAQTARRARPLKAGDVITTGMITGVHDIRVGQRARHVFEGLGEVHCCAVRAKPRGSRQ